MSDCTVALSVSGTLLGFSGCKQIHENIIRRSYSCLIYAMNKKAICLTVCSQCIDSEVR